MADRNTTIRASQLRNFSVTAEDLANESITGNKLVNGTISGSKLADGSVSEVKLEISNEAFDGYYLKYTAVSGMMWSEVSASSGELTNLDGGMSNSNYGGVGESIDGGNASSSF